MNIKTLIEESHKTATEKGWWDKPDRNVPELLALIHSEVSEALEAYRETGLEQLDKVWYVQDYFDTSASTNKPEGFTVELADILIRIADLCGEFNLDLEDALKTKMEYNKTRPYRHGNKVV